jgi:cell division protein FtsZ
MSEMGKAMMGTGEAEGDKRAIDAAEAAISNPLLDDTSMKGAKGVLINITGGMDMTLFEVDEAANRIRDEVDPEANIIFGSTFDEKLNGKIRVSVVATGIASETAVQPKPTVISLVGTQPAPAARTITPAAAASPIPGLRPQPQPQTKPAAAAAFGQPAVAQSKFAAPAAKASSPHAALAAAQRALREPELDIGSVEPAPLTRPEPDLRPEPSLGRPGYGRYDEVEHDMGTLQRMVTDIAEQGMSVPQHAPAAAPAAEPRRSGSLLDRLVNRGRAAAPPAAPTARAPEAPSPRLEARREPPAPRSGEDLDIPAFLRRQAN